MDCSQPPEVEEPNSMNREHHLRLLWLWLMLLLLRCAVVVPNAFCTDSAVWYKTIADSVQSDRVSVDLCEIQTVPGRQAFQRVNLLFMVQQLPPPPPSLLLSATHNVWIMKSILCDKIVKLEAEARISLFMAFNEDDDVDEASELLESVSP